MTGPTGFNENKFGRGLSKLVLVSSQVKVEVLGIQSCPTLCNPMNCSPPGSSVHDILPARILEWIASPFWEGFSWPRDWTQVACISGRFFTIWTTREAPVHRWVTGRKKQGPSPTPCSSRKMWIKSSLKRGRRKAYFLSISKNTPDQSSHLVRGTVKIKIIMASIQRTMLRELIPRSKMSFEFLRDVIHIYRMCV